MSTILSALVLPAHLCLAPLQIGPVAQLAPIDPPALDVGGSFGFALATDGDLLAVGAPFDFPFAPFSGRVWVFERSPDGQWGSPHGLAPDDPQPGQWFGCALDLEGDRLLVGAFRDAPLGLTGAGSAYVFERDRSGAWSQVAKLLPAASDDGAGFGRAVDLEGDRALVGAPSWNPAPFATVGHGRTYAFERTSGGAWAETQVLDAPPRAGGEGEFGMALESAGDRLLIGAPKADNGFVLNRGSVYEYARSSSTGEWQLAATIERPSTWGSVLFGSALDLDGDRLAVGATAPNAGTAGVFERQPSGQWSLAQTFTAPSGASNPNGLFGYAVVLEAERLLVTGPALTVDLANTGNAFLYERSPGGPYALAETLYPGGLDQGDNYGVAALFDGDRVLVGASGVDVPPITRAGRLFQFDLEPLSVDVEQVSLAQGGAQALDLQAGIAGAGDAYLVLGSLSGTAPGIPLGGGLRLPLVADPYLDLTLTSPSASPLVAPLGVLGPDGSGQSSFQLDAGTPPSLAGLTVHHAFVTLDPTSSLPTFVSNPAALLLVP